MVFTNVVHTKITSVFKKVLNIGIFHINQLNDCHIELRGQRNCTMRLKFATCKVEEISYVEAKKNNAPSELISTHCDVRSMPIKFHNKGNRPLLLLNQPASQPKLRFFSKENEVWTRLIILKLARSDFGFTKQCF